MYGNVAKLRPYSSSAPTTKLYINGKFIESQTTQFIDVHNPATNEVIRAAYEMIKAANKVTLAR